MVVLGIIGQVFVPSPGKKGSDVPLGFVSLRQPPVWVTDVLLKDALRGWHGPASPEVSIGPDAVRGHWGLLGAVEDVSALTGEGSWWYVLVAEPLSNEPGEACEGDIEVSGGSAVVALAECEQPLPPEVPSGHCLFSTFSWALLFLIFFFFLKNIFKKSEKINYCKVLFQVAFQRRPSSALSAPQFKRDLIWSYNDSWQKPSASRKIHTRAILWEKLLWAPVKINKTSQVKRGYKMRIKLVICYSRD